MAIAELDRESADRASERERILAAPVKAP